MKTQIIELLEYTKHYLYNDGKFIKRNLANLLLAFIGLVIWFNIQRDIWLYPLIWIVSGLLSFYRDKYGLLKGKIWSPIQISIAIFSVSMLSIPTFDNLFFAISLSLHRFFTYFFIDCHLSWLALFAQIYAFLFNKKKFLKISKIIIILYIAAPSLLIALFIIGGTISNLS